MKLWALSDLHLGFPANRQAFESLSSHPDDWLILGGDMGETEAHLALALDGARARFKKVIRVPGNHELWTVPSDPLALRGVARYERLVELCRERGVLTPEDPYPLWEASDPPHVLAPLFVLYDYSFRPDDVPLSGAVAWAREQDLLCADEAYLHPAPYPSREAWCAARVELTERRLAAVPREHPLVLINHFPLRRDLVRLWRIPRFSIWCGTRLTEDWHQRFNVDVVVSGHLHVRSTEYRDNVRFEEVSLGYPRHWRAELGIDHYLREILPGPPRVDR